jgi:DNA-binding NarL/FixJ family response regulator
MTNGTELSLCATTAAPLSQLVKVLVCDTQPVTVAGLRALLNARAEFLLAESADSLSHALDLIHGNQVDVLLIDKAFGLSAICEWTRSLPERGIPTPAIVVWCTVISAADTMRLIHAGVRGILNKTADVSALVACLRTVALGRVWMEETIFRRSNSSDHPRDVLTTREQEVLELVQHGLMNREIANRLRIKPGTVKIHMKHIFEKTGIRGRHSLALASYADGNRANHTSVQTPQRAFRCRRLSPQDIRDAGNPVVNYVNRGSHGSRWMGNVRAPARAAEKGDSNGE